MSGRAKQSWWLGGLALCTVAFASGVPGRADAAGDEASAVQIAREAWSNLDDTERRWLLREWTGELDPATRDLDSALTEADRRALLQTVEERLARGRAALRRGDPEAAIRVLRPVRADPRVAPFWQEAVDGHVYAQRELAARWFQVAQRTDGRARQHALGQAREILASLAQDFPGSVYAEPVLDALARVERTLDEREVGAALGRGG